MLYHWLTISHQPVHSKDDLQTFTV